MTKMAEKNIPIGAAHTYYSPYKGVPPRGGGSVVANMGQRNAVAVVALDVVVVVVVVVDVVDVVVVVVVDVVVAVCC